jgi:hypothetical protein
MIGKNDSGHPLLKMYIELDRADDPCLYDDLVRCKKGPRRVARFRLLAHDGAVSQLQRENGIGIPKGAAVFPIVRDEPSGMSGIEMELASDVFADPITEG